MRIYDPDALPVDDGPELPPVNDADFPPADGSDALDVLPFDEAAGRKP